MAIWGGFGVLLLLLLLITTLSSAPTEGNSEGINKPVFSVWCFVCFCYYNMVFVVKQSCNIKEGASDEQGMPCTR